MSPAYQEKLIHGRTTVLEQHGHRGLAAVEEGTKQTV